MHLRKSFLVMVLLLSIIGILACGGGGGSNSGGGTGTVSVGLTDSTTDQYRAVYITITDIQICANDFGSGNSGCSWSSLDPPEGIQFPKTYNLLKLVNGVTEAIGRGEFSAGTYNQIRLIIGDTPELENNLLGRPHDEANYIILNDGNNTIKPLKIPSGFNTGLKLVHPFTVGDGEIKELVLDFDACRSVVKAGNSGKYILKPTIKVIEPEGKIEIEGTVTLTDSTPPAEILASVSAQISDGLSATVVRSTITDDGSNFEAGQYILTLLSPNQIYNIVAYKAGYSPACYAYRDYDPDDEFPELPLDFELLAPTDFVTVSGEVTVEGGIDNDFPLVITIYTDLECNHPEGEGYVELTKVADIDISYVGNDVFSYTINLPTYDSPVTYYAVASSEGYIPDTGMTGEISAGDGAVTIDPLSISPSE